MQRIGVFVCHCGSNIAATVDVKKVAEMALHEPGVVHAEDYQYMCSEASDRTCRLFMFSAYARDDIQKCSGESGPEPVYGGNRQHP